MSEAPKEVWVAHDPNLGFLVGHPCDSFNGWPVHRYIRADAPRAVPSLLQSALEMIVSRSEWSGTDCRIHARAALDAAPSQEGA
jgi:hypothetical protein